MLLLYSNFMIIILLKSYLLLTYVGDSSSTQLYYFYIYYRLLYVSSLNLISSHSFSFIPFQVCANHRFSSWWIRSSFQNSRGLDSNILVYPLGVKICFQYYVIFLDLIYHFMFVRMY